MFIYLRSKPNTVAWFEATGASALMILEMFHNGELPAKRIKIPFLGKCSTLEVGFDKNNHHFQPFEEFSMIMCDGYKIGLLYRKNEAIPSEAIYLPSSDYDWEAIAAKIAKIRNPALISCAWRRPVAPTFVDTDIGESLKNVICASPTRCPSPLSVASVDEYWLDEDYHSSDDMTPMPDDDDDHDHSDIDDLSNEDL